MIFNKQGATIRKFKFYFQGQEVEKVKQYPYLGFTFIASWNKHQGFKSRGLCFKDTYLSLIDTFIKSFAFYDCESWGTPNTKIT